MELYEKEVSKSLNQDNKQYARILLQLERLNKVFASQSIQIANIEQRFRRKMQKKRESNDLILEKPSNNQWELELKIDDNNGTDNGTEPREC